MKRIGNEQMTACRKFHTDHQIFKVLMVENITLINVVLLNQFKWPLPRSQVAVFKILFKGHLLFRCERGGKTFELSDVEFESPYQLRSRMHY